MTIGVSAGFGRRFAALIYDAFLAVALLMIFTAISLIFTVQHLAVTRESSGLWFYVYRAGLITVLASYYVLNWMRSGQTLGMRAWKLRTVAADGRPMRMPTALLRFACGIFAWGAAGLGVLWLYLDSEHLALHDRLSKTRVLQLTGP